MSDLSAIWRLPGPSGFVRDARKALGRGVHVAAVLPRVHFEETEVAELLMQDLVGVRGEIEHVVPDARDGNLIEAIGAAAYIDEPPVTVRRLLTNEDVAGRQYGLSVADLSEEHLAEIPGFLRRLESDSRAVPAHERATFIVLARASSLEEGRATGGAEVALEQYWFWNRIARWDIAALLALQDRERQVEGLLEEVRLEAICEVARWDLDLALELASSWSGESASLLDHLGQRTRYRLDGVGSFRREHLRRPPAPLVEAWDEGGAGFWHDSVHIAPANAALDSLGVDRLVWSAQARVLLPWIELQRDRLVRHAVELLGEERFREETDKHVRVPYEGAREDVLEIGSVAFLLSRVWRDTRPRYTDTAHALRKARNGLAHLTPMSNQAIRDILLMCQWLA